MQLLDLAKSIHTKCVFFSSPGECQLNASKNFSAASLSFNDDFWIEKSHEQPALLGKRFLIGLGRDQSKIFMLLVFILSESEFSDQ